MIKTVVKYVGKELKAAQEYIELAYEKKSHCPETAELFITLAGEEINHAERLLKRGQILAGSTEPDKESPTYEHDIKNLAIWEWENEKSVECISALKMSISNFKAL